MHNILLKTSLFIGILVITACTTEFDTYILGPPTPTVYGVINTNDSVYQVRLSKSFVGPGNAYEYAQNTDSIYFPDAEVYLETYLNEDSPLTSVRMSRVQIIDRTEGIFASSPNYVYQVKQAVLDLSYDHFQNYGIPYENIEIVLKAIVPGIPDTLLARSKLKLPPRIINPKANYQKVYFYGELPFQMEWTHLSENNYFEIKVVLHFREVLEEMEREAQIEWILSGIEYNENSIPGGTNKFYAYYMRPETFYSQVRAHIIPDPLVKGRVARNVDFIILTSDPTIREYNRIGNLSDDYHGASFSNVENGLGIFTNFNTSGVYALRLGQRELDSLANGMYTKHLKFKNWE